MYLLSLSIFSIIYLHYSSSQQLLSNPKCNQRMDPGECRNYVVNWYYDRWGHRCREFFFSGCGGNENRFSTKEECTSQCHFVVEDTPQKRCSQPHDVGNCQSDIERWYFDWNLKRCVCSWWSGCGGNNNRYYSPNHCMEICGQFAEHSPQFIQPDYIPQRPLYRDEAYNSQSNYGSGTKNRFDIMWPTPPKEQPKDYIQQESPRYYGNYDTQQMDYRNEEKMNTQQQMTIEIPAVTTIETYEKIEEVRNGEKYIGMYEGNNVNNQYYGQILTQKEENYEKNDNQPQSNQQQIYSNQGNPPQEITTHRRPIIDPYFSGFVDSEIDNSEVAYLDSEAVLRGNINIENRENSYSGGYEDDAIPYEVTPQFVNYENEQYEHGRYSELRIGNEGYVSPPPSNDKPDDSAANQPLNIRGIRLKKDVKDDKNTIHQSLVVTEVKIPTFRFVMNSEQPLELTHIAPQSPYSTMVVPMPKRKRIKVPRKRPLGTIKVVANPIIEQDLTKETTEEVPSTITVPIQKHPAIQLTPTSQPEHISTTGVNEQGKIEEIVRTTENPEDYEEYYADMEELTDYDRPIETKETELFVEVPRQEVPTEAASWTKDPKFWHAAVPKHMVSTTAATQLQTTHNTIEIEEKVESPPTTIEVKASEHPLNTQQTIVETAKELDSTTFVHTVSTVSHTVYNDSIEDLPHSTVTSTTVSVVPLRRPTVSSRIPFRAPVPRPPKTLVDQWSWMRNVRPTRLPTSIPLNVQPTLEPKYPPVTVPTVEWNDQPSTTLQTTINEVKTTTTELPITVTQPPSPTTPSSETLLSAIVSPPEETSSWSS